MMAIVRQDCVNHAGRQAIGVCVMTKRPICAECSTRYEGVNYSKEGLALLHEQRARERADGDAGGGLISVLAWLLSPLAGYLVYLGYVMSLSVVIQLRETLLELMYGGDW